MTLQPYQQRVVEEKAQLDERLSKLVAFYDTGAFSVLDKAEQDRLHRQGQLMSEYSQVLGERIQAF